MRNKIIYALAIVIFLASYAGALDLKAGECANIDIEVKDNITWTAPAGIYVTQNNSKISICADILFANETFSIDFFKKQKEIIIDHYHSSGGYSNTIYRDNNVTTYVDREVDKPTNTTIIEKETIDKIPNNFIILFSIICICFISLIAYNVFLLRRRYIKDD